MSQQSSWWECIAELWLNGVEVDWATAHGDERRRRLPIPTYPFERQRHWVETSVTSVSKASRPQPKQLPAGPLKKSTDDWFYAPSWRRSTDYGNATGAPGCHVVFVDDHKLASGFVQNLAAWEDKVVVVDSSDRFERIGPDHWMLDVKRSHNYKNLLRALLEEGNVPTRITHFLGLSPVQSGKSVSQFLGMHSVNAITQACMELGCSSTINVVTNGIYSVTGHERIVAEKATVLGPCLVAPLEATSLHCRLIDVELDHNDRIDNRTRAMIVEEVCHRSGQAIVALRSGYRWTVAYEPVRLDRIRRQPLRRDGCYLITGGLGGIGFCFAQFLAKQAEQRTLVIMGRTELPEPEKWTRYVAESEVEDPIRKKLEQILSLRNDGLTVIYMSGDVARSEDVLRLSERLAERSLVLHGIFHAAGLPNSGEQPDERGIKPAMAAKVIGTRLLLDRFEPTRLDFVVLCSSVAAIAPLLGQSEYCAANAFLDAVAAEQRACGVNIIAVNWNAWQSVGMAFAHAMSLPEELRERQLMYLSLGISPEDAPILFERVLVAPLAQIVVTPVEFGSVIRGTEALNAAIAGPREAIPLEQSQTIAVRPSVQATYLAPSGDLEEGLVEIWQKLFAIAPIGVNDNFFDLGGHSLLATQLVYNISSTFQVELRLRDMLEHPTISSLAAKIEALILAEITAMSESEAEARLSESLNA
jgi:NAD(P)-dependent dehydrogenase (short-subunit alcohol dehydrogenase family)/acyl carrier protein